MRLLLILTLAAVVGALLSLLLPQSASAEDAPTDAPPNDPPSDPQTSTADILGSIFQPEPMNQNNVTAFCTVLRVLETRNRYDALCGGGYFTDFSDHPANLGWPGVRINNVTSHAAGAYQFEPRTWNYHKTKLNLPDFSPASQDAAAISDLQEHSAGWSAINRGDFYGACAALRYEWESLDKMLKGVYPVSLASAEQTFKNSGGIIV